MEKAAVSKELSRAVPVGITLLSAPRFPLNTDKQRARVPTARRSARLLDVAARLSAFCTNKKEPKSVLGLKDLH